ncbi:MAG: zinc ribbon domain-containing protein [Gemmataceae bacterium]
MIEDEDDDPTIPCPYCRKPIHEDSPRCPYCEQYISEEDAPPARKPRWLIVGAVVCLAVAVLWALSR